MRRWIWLVALVGCADGNTGAWEGQTFDCVDPAMNEREFVATLEAEPLNGVASDDFQLDDALLAVGDGCNLLDNMGLGLEADDPVRAIRQWRCEDGVIELLLDSEGTGDERSATLHTQRRRGTVREPMVFVCSADLIRR